MINLCYIYIFVRYVRLHCDSLTGSHIRTLVLFTRSFEFINDVNNLMRMGRPFSRRGKDKQTRQTHTKQTVIFLVCKEKNEPPPRLPHLFENKLCYLCRIFINVFEQWKVPGQTNAKTNWDPRENTLNSLTATDLQTVNSATRRAGFKRKHPI